MARAKGIDLGAKATHAMFATVTAHRALGVHFAYRTPLGAAAYCIPRGGARSALAAWAARNKCDIKQMT